MSKLKSFSVKKAKSKTKKGYDEKKKSKPLDEDAKKAKALKKQEKLKRKAEKEQAKHDERVKKLLKQSEKDVKRNRRDLKRILVDYRKPFKLTPQERDFYKKIGEPIEGQDYLELFTDVVVHDLRQIMNGTFGGKNSELVSSNHARADMIMDELSDLGFAPMWGKTGLGTNIVVMRHSKYPGVVFKFALDSCGVADNMNDAVFYRKHPDMYARYICCHPSGIVSVQEAYAPIFNSERMDELKGRAYDMITRLEKRYVIVDLSPVNYKNYAVRRNGTLVIIDGSDLVPKPEDRDILQCRHAIGSKPNGDVKFCGHHLEYTSDYNRLVCPVCGMKYVPAEMIRFSSTRLRDDEKCMVNIGMSPQEFRNLERAGYADMHEIWGDKAGRGVNGIIKDPLIDKFEKEWIEKERKAKEKAKRERLEQALANNSEPEPEVVEIPDIPVDNPELHPYSDTDDEENEEPLDPDNMPPIPGTDAWYEEQERKEQEEFLESHRKRVERFMSSPDLKFPESEEEDDDEEVDREISLENGYVTQITYDKNGNSHKTIYHPDDIFACMSGKADEDIKFLNDLFARVKNGENLNVNIEDLSLLVMRYMRSRGQAVEGMVYYDPVADSRGYYDTDGPMSQQELMQRVRDLIEQSQDEEPEAIEQPRKGKKKSKKGHDKKSDYENNNDTVTTEIVNVTEDDTDYIRLEAATPGEVEVIEPSADGFGSTSLGEGEGSHSGNEVIIEDVSPPVESNLEMYLSAEPFAINIVVDGPLFRTFTEDGPDLYLSLTGEDKDLVKIMTGKEFGKIVGRILKQKKIKFK